MINWALNTPALAVAFLLQMNPMILRDSQLYLEEKKVITFAMNLNIN